MWESAKRKRRKGPNGDSHQAEGRREQRQAPIYRLKDVIEEQRHSDIARARDEAGCETQPAANEEGDSSRQEGEQIKDTCNLRLQTRRRLCNPFHHFLPLLEGHVTSTTTGSRKFHREEAVNGASGV